MTSSFRLLNAAGVEFYSLSWSQLHGSGHSHSCSDGSPEALISACCSCLSMRPTLPAGEPSVKSIDLIVAIGSVDNGPLRLAAVLAAEQTHERGHHTFGFAGVAPPERGDVVVH